MFLIHLKLFLIFKTFEIFNMFDSSIHSPIELTANHICPIIQIIEQNFGIQDSIFFESVYIIKNDSSFTLKDSDKRYIEKKVKIISKSECHDSLTCTLSLICSFSKIEMNVNGDYDTRTSFQIFGHTSKIFGFLDMKFGKINQDILPTYRLLHYTSLSSE
jgi:hypothetical protein